MILRPGSVATFVQGTVVQGDLCPTENSPRRLLSKETFVPGASLKHNGCSYYFFHNIINLYGNIQ